MIKNILKIPVHFKFKRLDLGIIYWVFLNGRKLRAFNIRFVIDQD